MNFKFWDWAFLQEPAWRWAMFLVMVILFLGVWAEVQRHMGRAVA
jgi:hypothetical protein